MLLLVCRYPVVNLSHECTDVLLFRLSHFFLFSPLFNLFLFLLPFVYFHDFSLSFQLIFCISEIVFEAGLPILPLSVVVNRKYDYTGQCCSIFGLYRQSGGDSWTSSLLEEVHIPVGTLWCPCLHHASVRWSDSAVTSCDGSTTVFHCMDLFLYVVCCGGLQLSQQPKQFLGLAIGWIFIAILSAFEDLTLSFGGWG